MPGGQFEARCRFRDYDGVTRLVGRQGRTKTAAEDTLKAALRERQGRVGAQINGDTPLSVVGKAWLAEIKADEDMATGTKQLYSFWRPDWTPRHPARQLTERLQAACALVQAGNDPQAYSHSRLLMAATADAVGILCAPSVPAIDRWSITIAVADLVRHSSSTYTTNHPTEPDPAIAAARTAAVEVAHAGLQMPPHPAPPWLARSTDPRMRACHTRPTDTSCHRGSADR